MALTTGQLLLKADRQAQLTAALATADVADPLALLIVEAEAEVDRLTAGYTVAAAVKDSWARVITLRNAYIAAEMGVPDDIQSAYDAAMTELRRLSEDKVENAAASTPEAGRWGSATAIAIR